MTALRRASIAAGSCAFCALAIACGRRATQEDCQLIVDKSVELQLKTMSQTDAVSVAKREQQVRSELQGEIKSCEGRRVTDKTIACVSSASNPEELDRCLH